MKKASLYFIFIFVLMSLFLQPLIIPVSAVSVGEHDLFVSPTGNDSNEGTIDSPLFSVAAAKERLKALTGATDKAVTVWLREGTYILSEMLCFTAEDMPNVTYKAYDNEKVTISGANEIKGFTEETVNGVRSFTKQLDTSKDNWYFNSLFNDETTLKTPRFPETGYFTVAACSTDDALEGWENQPDIFVHYKAFTASATDVSSEFHNLSDVVVRILHYWKDDMMFVSGFDSSTGKISLSRPTSMTVRDIDRYFFENVFEALNEPGEWYADRQTGKLYYVPFEGEAANTLTLYSSHLTSLVSIDGVDGISFEDITFRDTAWELAVSEGNNEYGMDSTQAAFDVKGALRVKNAENISIKNCEFLNLGSTAVKMEQNVTNSTVDSCYFENIGATGIYVGGSNVPIGDDGSTNNITLRNNEIYKYGRIFFNAVGIQITHCDTAKITNNEIHDGFYTAISCGWTWGYSYNTTQNIKITDNLIYNIGQGWLSDMGGIYMLGNQPDTVISGNVIHNVSADAGAGGYGGWGIYLDEGSAYMTVEKNLVYCCGSQGLNIHYGEGNVFRNNISALNSEGQVSVGSRAETHATAYYYNNIFLTDGGAPIYINMHNTSHFYDNGNLLWDISLGEKLYFTLGGPSSEALSLKSACKKDFVHEPTVADPLFADAKSFNFTLAENSPAFTTGFKAWDYSVAGTLPNTIVGVRKQGGQTVAAESSILLTIIGAPATTVTADTLLLPLLLLTAVAFLLMIFAKGKPGVPENRVGFAIGTFVVMIPVGYFLYDSFTVWNQGMYALTSVVMLLLVGIPAAMAFTDKHDPKKKRILAYLLPTLILAVLFYGLIYVLNSVVFVGSTLACMSVLLLLAVAETAFAVVLLCKACRKQTAPSCD